MIAKVGLSKGDKILLALCELEKKRPAGQKITKEDLVVKSWELFPQDFCIKGYVQYPNADTSKYFTVLFRNNLMRGGFYNFTITQKGIEHAEKLTHQKPQNKIVGGASRLIISELDRIKKSKVFRLFVTGETNFLESDLFEFLGTSVRSLTSSNKTMFEAKYKLITEEVIPFCKIDNSQDSKKIIALWIILCENFKGILTGKKTK